MYKKYSCIICILLLALLSGCGKQIDDRDKYDCELIYLENGYVCADKGMYATAFTEDHVYTCDISEDGVRQVFSYELENYQVDIESKRVCVEVDEFIGLAKKEGEVYYMALEDGKYIVGNVKKTGEIIVLPVKVHNGDLSITFFQIDDNGNYYLGAWEKQYVVDKELNIVSEYEYQMEGFVKLKSGNVGITASDEKYMQMVVEIDRETLKEKDKMPLNKHQAGSGDLASGVDYDFLYVEGREFYGVNYEKKKTYLLGRWGEDSGKLVSVEAFRENEYALCIRKEGRGSHYVVCKRTLKDEK